ncbi:MAG: hypothetical protein AB1813_02030 [Verrucomicrobiota bacterium]
MLRSRILIVGRQQMARAKSKLHFVLITHDLSESSRQEILADFAHYPIVQQYTSEELEKFFAIKGAKVIGFAKSDLAKSIYAEMKSSRINRPASNKPEGASPSAAKESNRGNQPSVAKSLRSGYR